VISGSYSAISRKLKDGSKVEIEKAEKEEVACASALASRGSL
jgi:hypothetical protein